jgi:hypothetical protein
MVSSKRRFLELVEYFEMNTWEIYGQAVISRWRCRVMFDYFDSCHHGILNIPETAATLGTALFPFTGKTPCTKTLVAGIVTGEMAVPNEPFLEMTTGNKVDFLIITHLGRRGSFDVFS